MIDQIEIRTLLNNKFTFVMSCYAFKGFILTISHFPLKHYATKAN